MEASCLAFGFIISIIVGALKRVGVVERHPKTVAAILASIVAIAESLITHTTGTIAEPFVAGKLASVFALVSCVAVQFSASVASHEAIIKPITRSARA
jgi:hypothetical protein